MSFKRELRYQVFKISDMQKYLNPDTILELKLAGQAIEEGRAKDGKAPLIAAVVEQDWPEFEPTWAAIEKRCS